VEFGVGVGHDVEGQRVAGVHLSTDDDGVVSHTTECWGKSEGRRVRTMVELMSAISPGMYFWSDDVITLIVLPFFTLCKAGRTVGRQ